MAAASLVPRGAAFENHLSRSRYCQDIRPEDFQPYLCCQEVRVGVFIDTLCKEERLEVLVYSAMHSDTKREKILIRNRNIIFFATEQFLPKVKTI